MILEHITSSLLASLLALASTAGFTGDSIKAAIPRAQAQVAQSMNANYNGNSWNDWRGVKPVIKDIDPEEGPVGTSVTLTGARFTDDSIVRLGRGMVTDVNVSDDGTSLSFVVPEDMGRYCPPWRNCTDIAYAVTPGEYNVRIQNGTRTSNVVHFEVTDDTNQDEPLAINGVSGPADLAVGEEGSWTLDVASQGEGNLQYSVKWGDENWSPLRFLSLEDTTQSSATFTHTYNGEGTYHPEFTVTDENGNTVASSTTVVVGDEDTDVPHLTSLSSSSATVGSMVTITGTGFDADSSVQIGSATGTDVDVQSDTQITFTVPALSLGTHGVTVTDNDGTSNTLNLAVIADSKVSINGVDAPTRLAVGEDGTWTVHAASNASGNLKYSVDWGEGMMARMIASDSMTQSSATFTHSYDSEGTYYPMFTVTDENGVTASVSASVVVTSND